jgi:monoamine oxidase
LENSKIDQNKAWDEWTNVYGAVSMRHYLFNPEKYIKEFEPKLPNEYIRPKIYPKAWSEKAINAFNHSSYTPLLEASYAELAAEDLGHWWSSDPNGMFKFEGGMEALPAAFVQYQDKFHLSRTINYGVYVNEVDYNIKTDKNGNEYIVVKGFSQAHSIHEIKASRVIFTVPMTILKNVHFQPPLDSSKIDAITNVSYTPSTKILMQFKERFWEGLGIVGGFSKSTDTLGQLHYPDERLGINHRGVIISYTWNRNAQVFAAQKDNNLAVRHAVQQVQNLHPDIEVHSLFEQGDIQPWFSEPYTCGAFVYYDAYSVSLLEKLAEPTKMNGKSLIFYAGEGISHTHGWIQGAMESALNAALLLRCSLLNDDKAHLKDDKAHLKE